MDVKELLERYNNGERNFVGIHLSFKDIRGENLSGANFSNSFLRHSDFYGANLTKTIFNRINLSNLDLSGANLWGTRISTNLTNTNLSKADLIYADLRDSIVAGTNFEGAIFYRTIMPDGSVNNSSRNM